MKATFREMTTTYHVLLFVNVIDEDQIGPPVLPAPLVLHPHHLAPERALEQMRHPRGREQNHENQRRQNPEQSRL